MVIRALQLCAYKSITPMQFVNNIKATDAAGNEVAVWDDVCSRHPSRIYLLLGTNALASGSNETFLLYYEKLVDMLKEQFPDVPLYIEGLPPVTEKRFQNPDHAHQRANPERLMWTSRRWRRRRAVTISDLYSALADDDRALPTEIAQEDGIHMNQQGCQRWIDYLLNHRAKEDNGRV